MIDTDKLLESAKPYPCGGTKTGSFYWLHPQDGDGGPGTLPAEIFALLPYEDCNLVMGIPTYPDEVTAMAQLRAAVTAYRSQY